MTKVLLVDEDNQNSEKMSMEELIAQAVKDIAMNNMKILEVTRYQIKDDIEITRKKKLKHTSFVAHTLKEVDVVSIDSKAKKGYLVLNDGSLDYPLVSLKLNDGGPWYHTNKEKALDQVKRMNEAVWDSIQELEEELTLSKEYMRNLIENGRI